MDDANPGDDLEEFQERLRAMLQTAEVMSILFTRVSQSLIIDFRHTESVGPRIMTDHQVGSAHDRFLSFGKLRPTLPLPEQLTLAFWTPAVREFEEIGMLEALRERCRAAGGAALSDEANDSYHFLIKLERQYLSDMVRGVGMRTLWERARG